MDVYQRCCIDCWPKELIDVSTEGMHSVVTIPKEVVDAILGNGCHFIVAPGSFGGRFSAEDRSDFDDDDEFDGKGDDDEDEEEKKFKEASEKAKDAVEAFEKVLDAEIAKLGGLVLPKCNWSAPKDATWMSPDETMRCFTGAQVMLLLRSSDDVAADLEFARARHITPHVCLKKWESVPPSLEFRCFVIGGSLRGIAQRNMENYYQFLKDNKEAARAAMVKFFNDRIAVPLHDFGDYLLDLYMEEDMKTIHVVDIAPLTKDLNRLVGEPIEWNKLQEQTTEVPLIIVESRKGIQPAPRNMCGVPIDIRDAKSSDLTELINEMQRQHFHETHESKH